MGNFIKLMAGYIAYIFCKGGSAFRIKIKNLKVLFVRGYAPGGADGETCDKPDFSQKDIQLKKLSSLELDRGWRKSFRVATP